MGIATMVRSADGGEFGDALAGLADGGTRPGVQSPVPVTALSMLAAMA